MHTLPFIDSSIRRPASSMLSSLSYKYNKTVLATIKHIYVHWQLEFSSGRGMPTETAFFSKHRTTNISESRHTGTGEEKRYAQEVGKGALLTAAAERKCWIENTSNAGFTAPDMFSSCRSDETAKTCSLCQTFPGTDVKPANASLAAKEEKQQLFLLNRVEFMSTKSRGRNDNRSCG